MKENILKSLWVLMAGVAVLVAVALIIRHRPTEEPVMETEPEIPVMASVEEETTHEEKTTAVAVAAAKRAAVVAPETTEAETTEVPSYTVEELARYVLNNGINGPEREAYLGDRYDEVQEYINATHVPTVQYEAQAYDPEPAYYEPYGDVLTPAAGVNYYAGRMETYYNLPMGGVIEIMRAYGYDYDYWVRSDGVKMFGSYVMVAADFGQYPRGTILDCSLGTAIVCDTGAGGWDWLDIAVTW